MEEESALGNSIKQRRHALGLSLNHLADATGLHKSFLSRVESGAVRQPASDSLRRIAAALELPETELYGVFGFKHGRVEFCMTGVRRRRA